MDKPEQRTRGIQTIAGAMKHDLLIADFTEVRVDITRDLGDPHGVSMIVNADQFSVSARFSDGQVRDSALHIDQHARTTAHTVVSTMRALRDDKIRSSQTP